MNAAHTLVADQVTLGYADRTVVEQLTLTVPPGGLSVIVGPNAGGKSTVLRALSRLLRPREGVVRLDGTDVRSIPGKQLARTLGLLPQSPIAPEGILVADLVARGRNPHQSAFSRWSAADDRAVAAALLATGTADLADRAVDELSGGQRQRVWIALALAQETDILLLDEPTTYLDLSHQIEVLDLLRDLNRLQGRTVVAVLHDLNLAARYADHLIAVAGGAVQLSGPPAEVVTSEMVRRVFGVDCRVIDDPVSGTPMVVPIGRHDAEASHHPETALRNVRDGAAERARRRCEAAGPT